MTDRNTANKFFEKYLLHLGVSKEQVCSSLEKSTYYGTSGKVSFLNSKIGEIAIKRGHSKETYNAIREYAALSILEQVSKGIAPLPYYVDNEENILIMERILGKTPKVIDDLIIEMMADSLTKVHSKSFTKTGLPHLQKPACTTPLDRLAEQITFLRDWFSRMNKYTKQKNPVLAASLEKGSKEIIANAKKYESAFLKRGFVLTHYDINPENIILNPHRDLVLLDWGQSYIADPSMDIAKFFYKCYLNQKQQDTFLSRYKFSDIGESEFRKRISVYYPLVRLGSYCWRIRVLNEDTKNIKIAKSFNLMTIKIRLQGDINFIIEFSKRKISF